MRKFAVFNAALLFGLMLGLAVFVSPAVAEGPVHWGYDGEEGPAHWGELSPDYALCAGGAEQSPVDIPATAAVNPADIGFSYQPSGLNLLNNGHTIQINYDAGSEIEVAGKKYNLLQFHFHALSEHTVAGQPSPMELHLVHQSDDGQFAVVGVMMNRGDENAALATIWEHLPAEESEAMTISGVSVNAADLLPVEQSYHRYNGSFTTPPCTEGVNWFVMANTIELSDEQATDFAAIYNHNYRPVQPLNDRTFLTTAQPAEAAPGEAAPSEVAPSEAAPSEPQTLPVSGGESASLAVLLLALGLVAVGGGFYLQRRKMM